MADIRELGPTSKSGFRTNLGRIRPEMTYAEVLKIAGYEQFEELAIQVVALEIEPNIVDIRKKHQAILESSALRTSLESRWWKVGFNRPHTHSRTVSNKATSWRNTWTAHGNFQPAFFNPNYSSCLDPNSYARMQLIASKSLQEIFLLNDEQRRVALVEIGRNLSLKTLNTLSSDGFSPDGPLHHHGRGLSELQIGVDEFTVLVGCPYGRESTERQATGSKIEIAIIEFDPLDDFPQQIYRANSLSEITDKLDQATRG